MTAFSTEEVITIEIGTNNIFKMVLDRSGSSVWLLNKDQDSLNKVKNFLSDKISHTELNQLFCVVIQCHLKSEYETYNYCIHLTFQNSIANSLAWIIYFNRYCSSNILNNIQKEVLINFLPFTEVRYKVLIEKFLKELKNSNVFNKVKISLIVAQNWVNTGRYAYAVGYLDKAKTLLWEIESISNKLSEDSIHFNHLVWLEEGIKQASQRYRNLYANVSKLKKEDQKKYCVAEVYSINLDKIARMEL
jgi:hypothetical protein